MLDHYNDDDRVEMRTIQDRTKNDKLILSKFNIFTQKQKFCVLCLEKRRERGQIMYIDWFVVEYID